ncbi:IclR family transcriptional regulator [Paraburkholderia phymatum]|uniref:IclR family transcriptional regulator n=1 Tax=Paraburkholderia phymatum TaxID=148447 RepID=UPI0031778388
MSKFGRMIDVLDLYSDQVTLLTAEEVSERLGVSRPTAFRYMRELTAAGFLANYSGRYTLGARIIMLDYKIRESDPVLREARAVMTGLSTETACDSILCRMYNDEIIHIHHEPGHAEQPPTVIGRGRTIPLFRGAAGKVMLAFLPSARLKRIYERNQANPDLDAIGHDWPTVKAHFAKIRQVGFYISIGELDSGTLGIAAPIYLPTIGPLGVISLVLSRDRLSILNEGGLATLLKARTKELAERLSNLAAHPPSTVDQRET